MSMQTVMIWIGVADSCGVFASEIEAQFYATEAASCIYFLILPQTYFLNICETLNFKTVLICHLWLTKTAMW